MKELVHARFKGRYPRVLTIEKVLLFFGFTRAAGDLKRLVADFIAMQIDPVTGLVQRRVFFETLIEYLRLEFPDFETTGELGDVDSTKLVVSVGDLAFLNFFNATSHALGDSVLKRVSGILMSESKNSWLGRLGGDEIGIWTSIGLNRALEMKKEAERKISSEPDHYVDTEYATAVDVKEFVERHSEIERTYSVLAQIFFDIAMARAQITKCYKRLDILIRAFLTNDGSYQKLIPYGRKGAGNVTDRQIESFARSVNNGTDVSIPCMEFALRFREEAMQGDPYEQAIFIVASKIFYE